MAARRYERYLAIVFFVFLPLLGGCASNPVLKVNYDDHGKSYNANCGVASKISSDEIANALKHHIVDINKKGSFNPIQFSIDCPDKRQSGVQENDLHNLVTNIVDAIEKGKFKKLLIYIHGGLVEREAGVESAIKLTRAVLNDPDLQDETKTYPVSIVWRSGGWESYADQLFSVRNGEVIRPLAIPTSPFKFGSDLGRGIVDTPFAGGVQAYRLFQTVSNRLNLCDPDTDGGARVICPDDQDYSSISALKTVGYFLLTPLRIATSPIINGLGRPGYENMIRHTRSAFLRDKPEPLPVGATDGHEKDGYEGGVYLFFKELQEHLPADVKLTLIGHSMGTMLASETIHQFPNLSYEHVVFMGAAVSIRDFQNTVLPRFADRTKGKIEFYNLSLLPAVDAREFTDSIGAIPSGSLLEWIDEMYTSPPTLADRTLGKWVNIKRVLPTFPKEAREKMTMRVYGEKEGQPQGHGEFNDIDKCFWRKTFWTATESEWAQHHKQCTNYLTRLSGDKASR